jgi:LmbE family N-acetylglucosaminyl deacetylase
MTRTTPSLRHRLGRLLAARRTPWRSLLDDLAGPTVLAPTGVEIVRQLPRERVLVLAPHPDDEIIGAGGTLARYRDGGSHVTVVYLTDGGGPPTGAERDELIGMRRREAEEVGRLLGLEQIFWPHPDTRLDPAAATADLAALLARTAPDAVYLPSWFERHVDHYAANVLLARALETAGGHPSIHGYEVWDNLPCPNRVVDVTATLERKLTAMDLYATPMRYTDFGQLIRHRGALHHLLHVDPRRAAVEGAAETFLRLTAEEYGRRFREWDERLRRDGSPLTDRGARR